MTTSKTLCLIMILCLFFSSHPSIGYSLVHEDGIEGSSTDAVSTRKGIDDNAMMGGRKVMNGDKNGKKSENVEEFGKKKTKTRGSVGGDEADEDGLVAYTADYWRARHHPPKNN